MFFRATISSRPFSDKRYTFVMNRPRISDPYSVPFNLRYSMPMFEEDSKITFIEINYYFKFCLDLRVGLIVARN